MQFSCYLRTWALLEKVAGNLDKNLLENVEHWMRWVASLTRPFRNVFALKKVNLPLCRSLDILC